MARACEDGDRGDGEMMETVPSKSEYCAFPDSCTCQRNERCAYWMIFHPEWVLPEKEPEHE
jgi:hypothetical protein